nr:hypothetical protein [Tanacetum cinerariifolium]
MPVTRQGTNDAMTPKSIQAIGQAIQRNSTHTQDDASQSLGGGLRRPVQPARVYSYTDFMKCQPLNFKGTEGVVGLVKGNDVAAYTQRFQELALMCTKFLADEIEKLANELMDQKLRTYAKRQNENKRKADDSPRNNQLQPHKKQNVARAYTVALVKRRFILETYLCALSAIIITLGNVQPSVENARGHIKKNCPNMKNRWNCSGNGIAQRRAYALGGRDASPDSNVITGTFLNA